MSQNTSTQENTRSSPRAVASLEVNVTVAGEPQKVLLVSQDIGTGGMFLRTTVPAPSWSRVELSIAKPDGTSLTIGGEVVRSVSLEQAKANRQAPGMAVAFDEVSRPKRKELVELVLDLCSRRPTPEERGVKREQDPLPPQTASPAEVAPADSSDVRIDAEEAFTIPGTDALLDQLDDILDEVESSQASVPVLTAQESDPAIDQDDPLDLAADSFGGIGSRTAPAVAPGEPPLAQREPAQIPVEIEAAVAPAPAALETPVFNPPLEDESSPEPVAEDDAAIEELRVFLRRYKKALKGDTHYDVLLIKRSASHEKISIAYKKLLFKLKPPAPPEAMPEDLVKQLASVLGKIRKAFAILAKPDRKKAYDFLIDNEENEA